ncbi:MAG: O-antigen ligase family protein [Anaeroplasmataceae bacterium]|nr:O-antigen ligase family protein [Anaeroplasmataceae bacterium]
MCALRIGYKKVNNFVNHLTNMRFFNEIYAAIIAVIALIGWQFSNNLGMILLTCFGTISLIFTQDLKYVIPNVLFFIFTFSTGFANDTIPIHIIILAGIFFIVVMFFSFKEGIHLRKMHSLLGLLGLALSTLLPFCWTHNAPSGNEVFYFFYVSDLGYLLIYMIMVNGIRKNGVELLAVSMSYLGILITIQCGITVWKERAEFESILQNWFHLGWGLCNEAGIMICVSIPFIFYLLGKQMKATGIIFQHTKLLFVLVGMIITNSRGSYLFGGLEVVILYFVLFFKGKNKKLYQNLFFGFGLLVLFIMLIGKDYVIKLIDNILKYVFDNALQSNGRIGLYKEAYHFWGLKPHYKLFGPGITIHLYELSSALGLQLMPSVYHSTFFETLITGGIFGIAIILIHFYQKYRNLYRCDKFLFLVLGIGFLCIDAYGMIDNTYHMYYFMIPLAITMATIDASLKSDPIELKFCPKEIYDSLF